jgi:hypothetical protein
MAHPNSWTSVLLGVAGYFISGPLSILILMWTISEHHDDRLKAAEDVFNFFIGYAISATLGIPQVIS